MASSSSASLDVATLQANRSVNDFHSVEDLQKALTTMDMTRVSTATTMMQALILAPMIMPVTESTKTATA